jgi:hypothetical protein
MNLDAMDLYIVIPGNTPWETIEEILHQETKMSWPRRQLHPPAIGFAFIALLRFVISPRLI